MGWDKVIRWKFNEKEGEGWVYNFFPLKGLVLRYGDLNMYVKNKGGRGGIGFF